MTRRNAVIAALSTPLSLLSQTPDPLWEKITDLGSPAVLLAVSFADSPPEQVAIRVTGLGKTINLTVKEVMDALSQ